MNIAAPGLDTQYLGAALFALESLTQLIGHRSTSALLLHLHRLITASDGAVTALGDDHLRAAFIALISLAYLVGHYALVLPTVVITLFASADSRKAI